MIKAACLLMLLGQQALAHETLSEDSACARYLGNEGVLVSYGKTKVLFDAFYSDSYGQYALIKDETRQQIMQGIAPFDDVEALFVSHVHGDHFSAEPTLEYLNAHPNVKLYASQQVISHLQQAGDVNEKQLQSFTLNRGDPAQSLTVGDLSIDAVRIPHSGWPDRRVDIENIAFRVSLDNGLTVMHLGDADPNTAHFEPYREHWDSKVLNTAFPPYWFFDVARGREILEDYLKAQQSIGIHVPEAAEGRGDEWREKLQGDLFTDRGEIRSLGGRDCHLSRAHE